MRRIPPYNLFYSPEKNDFLFSSLKFTLPATFKNTAYSFLYSLSWLLYLSKWLQTDEILMMIRFHTSALHVYSYRRRLLLYPTVILLWFHFCDSYIIYFKLLQIFYFRYRYGHMANISRNGFIVFCFS